MLFLFVTCISIYFLAIFAVKHSKSVSLDESQKVVNKFMKKYLQEFWLYLFPNQQAAQNWLADNVLIQYLLEAQAPYNRLSQEHTFCERGYYLGKIPYVSLLFIPKPNADFNALTAELENAVIDRLSYLNVVNCAVSVLFEKIPGGKMHINVLYAVTDTQKNDLNDILAAITGRKVQKVCATSQPPIDKGLENDIKQGRLTPASGSLVQVGYDAQTRVPINIDITKTGMIAVVGGTGSGKSVAVLYLLYNVIKTENVELFIADFKRSGDFIGISQNYAEAEEVTSLIEKFYDIFQNAQEGSEKIHLLLIDEYAGYITWLTQQDKKKADEIKGKISTLLMMGRSRHCFVWCVQQRISASLFPSGIGAIDNFQVCIGMGRLSPDSRKSLFAGEHLQNQDFEAGYNPGTGQGLILVDGQPLQALQIPDIDKKKLQRLLTI